MDESRSLIELNYNEGNDARYVYTKAMIYVKDGRQSITCSRWSRYLL